MKDSPRNYSFHFFPAQSFNPEVVKTKQDKAIALLNEYASVLELVVKKYPEQWFNYYNFWENKAS
jgi:predicted LPLAT superfamily acyltransferase